MTINDFYSVSYLPISENEFIDELNIISKIYRAHGVKRIFLAREYDTSITVTAHVQRESHYFSAARKSLCPRIKIVPIHTITLFKGISAFSDLEKLALKTNTGAFLYIKVPFGIDQDTLASELHNIIYKRKLTPVFVSTETLQQFCSERMFKTILAVPNAVYQISFSHLAGNKSVYKLLNLLVKQKKNIIFGSGSDFDACLYRNIDFYIKHIRCAVKDCSIGYFLMRHNKLF